MNPALTLTVGLGPVEHSELTGYGQLKLDIASHLTKQDVTVLMTFLEFDRAAADAITRAEFPQLRFVEKLDMLKLISPEDITYLLSALDKVGLSGVCIKVKNSIDDYATRWLKYRESEADSRKQRFLTFLRQLGLQTTKSVSLIEAMEIRKCHVDSETEANILDEFISKITCYDHRIHKRRKLGRVTTYSGNSTLDTPDWADVDSDDDDTDDNSEGNEVSSRDILYAILSCLDPFLLQEVFAKMSACQLAVPLLMPNVMNNSVDFRLWCLRKISKSWFDHKTTSIQTESIASYSLLTVAALRFGTVNPSKSNILNKLFGFSQDSEEHAFFNCSEQDSTRSHWSQGSLECIWYLPNNEIQTKPKQKESEKLREVLAVLNLRGDATEFEAQTTFAVQNSFATIIFVDSKTKKQHKKQIDRIRQTSHVILILCSSDLLKRNREMIVVEHDESLTSITNVVGKSAGDIGDLLADRLVKLIKENESLKRSCLDKSTQLCKDLGIRVDENILECMEAKKTAEEITNLVKAYDFDKEKIFPAQSCWNMDLSESVQHDEIYNVEPITELDIETQIATAIEMENVIRRKQLDTPSEPIKKFCDSLLSLEPTTRQYFLEWQQIFLNNLTLDRVKPLHSQVKAKSAEIRALSSDIIALKAQFEHPQSDKVRKNLEQMLTEKSTREAACIEEKEVLIGKIGNSIGLEHFMREVCHSFEAFCYFSQITEFRTMNYEPLTSLAASMLLNGTPIEILNGDSKIVHVNWVGRVFQEVIKLLRQNARIYVISVLGIQSSGKSTLLNSLFGVRFAVSAGRCTRGAFLQLLPVSMSLRNEINCDYIAIVDTEGLRAPEKRDCRNSITQDNELATFALCISDLTLINIGGQTMGEDMTNVLQIAAHAFIRMKEVDLNAECRIIQQFVADVNAEEKNEAAMQSIVSVLDDAMREAAINEGKSHLYRQFSDVFVVQNYDKESDATQYIPSLWRSFMTAPNFQYGVSIQKLKASILECIKRSDTCGSISEFISRMTDVWNAIGKEDFVFSFQNTKEANLYEQFTSTYRNLITPVRSEVIGMQITSRKKIEDSKVGETQIVLKKCMDEIQQFLNDKCDCVIKTMSKLLKEAKYESVQKHETYFKLDLQTIQKRILADASAELQHLVHLQEEIMGKDEIVKKISDNLRQNMAKVAVGLRSRISTNTHLGKRANKLDRFVQQEFEKIWCASYESLEDDHPCRSVHEILIQNEKYLRGSITAETQNTSLMMKDYLTKSLSSYAVSSKEVVEDFHAVNKFRSALNTMDSALNQRFQILVGDIESMAKNTDQFQRSAVEAVIKLEKFLSETNINIGLFHVILFICTRFSHVSHREQCAKETETLSRTKHANDDFFPDDIVFTDIVADTLCAIASEVLKKSNITKEKMKKHFANCIKDSSTNDHWYSKMLWWKTDESNDEYWKEPFQYKLTTFFNDIEKGTNQCFCTERFMYLYCQNIGKYVNQSKQVSKNITIPDNRKTFAIFLALQRGITQFKKYYTDYIAQQVNSDNYCMRFSSPLDFPQMEDKIEFINKVFIERNSVFSSNYSFFLDSIGRHIQKYINLPPYLPTLQFLDKEFLTLLPLVNTEKSHAIHTTVHDIKMDLAMKNLAPFSPNTVLEHISRIIHQRDENARSKFTNDEKCAIVLHVAAWILPFTAVAQYQFEKHKNVAIQIRNEKESFRRLFISLCNEHKDKIAAQAFCGILKVSIRDGATARVFPILYSRLTNKQPEFRRKRTFIGHVFVDLFQTDDYQGLTNFLQSFEKVGLAWILQRIATLCNKRHDSLLHTTYKKCVEEVVDQFISVLAATQKHFKTRKT